MKKSYVQNTDGGEKSFLPLSPSPKNDKVKKCPGFLKKCKLIDYQYFVKIC